MRKTYIAIALAAGISVAGCTREDRVRRREPAAREVGREAYEASQEIKRGAKKAGRELRDAGKELREGWNEAKRDSRRPDPEPRRR